MGVVRGRVFLKDAVIKYVGNNYTLQVMSE